MRRLTALVFVTFVVLAACGGGTKEEVGTLVGFEAMSGEIEDIDFGAVLILELDDGTEVRAQAAQEFVTDELTLEPSQADIFNYLVEVVRTGGGRYRIEFNEQTEIWTVLERLDE